MRHPPANSPTSPRMLTAADRQRQALELRRGGANFEEIARVLGYQSRASAYRAVMAGLHKTLQEPADEVRRLELERLDALTLALWPEARRGHLGAIEKLLKIMERRAKLLGLDAPTRQEHSGPEGGAIPLTVIDRVLALPEGDADA